MSAGAGDKYKGYYIKTMARAVNPHSAGAFLFEGSAAVTLDPGSTYDGLPESHVGEDQVFGTEFEAHRHAERAAKRYIDSLSKN